MHLAQACLLGTLSLISSGCATSLQGGAQTVLRTDGHLSQEATFAASAGLGDGSSFALLTVARGSVGADLRTGRALGSATGGLEWRRYGGTFDSVTGGFHVGLHGGATFEAAGRGATPLVFAEFGYAWVLDRSRSCCRLTALALAPMIGMSAPADERHPVLLLGLGLTLRSDSFSEWKWHL